MVTIKNDNQFDRYIVSQIIDCQTENIKFQNITFDCKTITDAKGNVFSIQPEQKKGKWREMNHDLGFECSECGWESYYKYDFCPNCGARMEVEEDE